MRTLEIVLAFVLFIRIVLPIFRRESWIEWISLTALAIMGLHLIIEGYRWQMIPLYGIVLGLSLYSVWRLAHPKSNNHKLRMGTFAQVAGGLLLLGIAILPPILLPVPRTPKPTGPYQIGTSSFLLIDESRKEIYAQKEGESRAIMVQIWYPAEKVSGVELAPWLENMDIMGPAIAAHLDLPSFFLDHVKYAQSHAFTDAPIASGNVQYPLLLFSHGWGGFRAQNTFQVEELASQGYIVAAPDHTYGATATVFPDGHVALNNPEALPAEKGLSDDEFLAAVQVLGDQWSGDLSFILDTLQNLKPDDPAGQLMNRIDFSRVGVLGHSTGGGAAIQFCARDERCQAVLGMDPYMDPVSYDVLDRGISKPYLAMFSAVWAEDRSRNNRIFEHFSSNANGDGYQYYIEQTAHYDFTDMPAFSPLAPHLGLKGPLDGEQVSKIVNAYTLAFFGHYFKGETAPLLEQPSPDFPEMVYLSQP